MNAAKPTTILPAAEREQQPSDLAPGEVRLLDELELVLAGGGESDANWP